MNIVAAPTKTVRVTLKLEDGDPDVFMPFDGISVDQELLVQRRGRRYLVQELGGEAGPIGIGGSTERAVLDYLRNRLDVEGS